MSEYTVVNLNGVDYWVRGPVSVETITDYAQAFRTTSDQRRSDRTGKSSHAFSFDSGFSTGRVDFSKLDTLSKFYDSECETRFEGQVSPPYLVNTATGPETDADGNSPIFSYPAVVAQENFDDNLFGLAHLKDAYVGYEYWKVVVFIFDPDHGSTQWDEKAEILTADSESPNEAFIRTRCDIKRHANYLFASLLKLDGGTYTHKIYRTTTGGSWADVDQTPNLPAAAVSDDTNLLLSFGVNLLIVLWDNSAGDVLVYKSTDSTDATPSNVNWSLVCSIASAGPVLGLTSWINQDGDDVPWIRLRESWGWIDIANTTYVPVVNVPTETSTAGGMTVWGGDLYVPEQEGMNRCFYSNGALNVQAIGLNRDVGLIAEDQGHVTAMTRSNRWLFVAYGGLAAGKKACIFAWDGEHWHFVAKHGTANQKITALAVSSSDDDLVRLHYHVLTLNNTVDHRYTTTGYYIDYILDNQKQNTSIKYETGKTITTPQFGGDEPETNGTAYRLDMDADALVDGEETIGVKYGLNGAAASTTSLGTFNATTTTLSFGSGVGVAFKTIQFEFTMNRNTNTDRPLMYNPVLWYKKRADRRRAFTFHVDLEETRNMNSALGTEDIVSNLEALYDTRTLLAFEYGRMASTSVELVHMEGNDGAAEEAGDNRPQERVGYRTVRLEEPI